MLQFIINDHNKILSRDDLVQTLSTMFDALQDSYVMGTSGIYIGNHSAHYAPRVALLEGWSRLLWGIVPFIAGGCEHHIIKGHLDGIKNGVNPQSPDYWGDVNDYDQRMVEMAAIALGLMMIPDKIWDPLSEIEKQNLFNWMDTINQKKVHPNNWIFFRVLVNSSFKLLKISDRMDRIQEDLDFIDSLYAADGWYKDNIPYDFYNPFALHFYGLIYAKYMKDFDYQRCINFEERAKIFAHEFIHFFSSDGSVVPYGRSLTYRFAVVSFFSACAFNNIEVLPWGLMKGIVLRNFRWWFSKPIFDSSAHLTVGYEYPSLIMAEQYNAPASPYWALKSYLILALRDEHPFWRSEEADLPLLEEKKLLKTSKFILMRKKTDIILLTGGQNPQADFNNGAAKYSKFAYSNKFSFSVGVSHYGLEKTGCDSMLYLSEGDNYWRERRDVSEPFTSEEFIFSKWHPWKDVEISTWLIPYDFCHIRVHKIDSQRVLETAEGGFALRKNNGFDLSINPQIDRGENYIKVLFPWGCSLIADVLNNRNPIEKFPMPNLNLSASTTVVPMLEGTINKGTSYLISIVQAVENIEFLIKLPNIEFIEKKGLIIIDQTIKINLKK